MSNRKIGPHNELDSTMVTRRGRIRPHWGVSRGEGSTLPTMIVHTIICTLSYFPFSASSPVRDLPIELRLENHGFAKSLNNKSTVLNWDDVTSSNLQGTNQRETQGESNNFRSPIPLSDLFQHDLFLRYSSQCPDIDYITGAMYESDVDGNGVLDKEEYVVFLDSVSGGYLSELDSADSFLDMPLSLQESYLVLSCLCELYDEQPWGGEGCCSNSDSGIQTVGSAPGEGLTPEEEEYLTYICGTVSESLESVGAKLVPPPTISPINFPTKKPTKRPTRSPTAEPTKAPTAVPTMVPTDSPSTAPTSEPTDSPTDPPTADPSRAPSANPTKSPSAKPTIPPTIEPSAAPTANSPTGNPTTSSPSSSPVIPFFPTTPSPSILPLASPTAPPTTSDTSSPSRAETSPPTLFPVSMSESSPPTTAAPFAPSTSLPPSSGTSSTSPRPPSSTPTTGTPTTAPIPNPTIAPTSSPAPTLSAEPSAPTASPLPTVYPTLSPTSPSPTKEEGGILPSPTTGPTLSSEPSAPTVSPMPTVSSFPTATPVTGGGGVVPTPTVPTPSPAAQHPNPGTNPSPNPGENNLGPTTDTIQSNSLSTGAIVAIALACIAVIFGLLSAFYAKRKRRDTKDDEFDLERQNVPDEAAARDGLYPSSGAAATALAPSNKHREIKEVGDSWSVDDSEANTEGNTSQEQLLNASKMSSTAIAPSLGRLDDASESEISEVHSDFSDVGPAQSEGSSTQMSSTSSPLAAVAMASTLVASTPPVAPYSSQSAEPSIYEENPFDLGEVRSKTTSASETSNAGGHIGAVPQSGGGAGGTISAAVASSGEAAPGGLSAGAAVAVGAAGALTAGAMAAGASYDSKRSDKVDSLDSRADNLSKDDSFYSANSMAGNPPPEVGSSPRQPFDADNIMSQSLPVYTETSESGATGASSSQRQPVDPDNFLGDVNNSASTSQSGDPEVSALTIGSGSVRSGNLDELDAAIESGNWGAVGALAAILASEGRSVPPSEKKFRAVVTSKSEDSSARSGSRGSSTGPSALDQTRAAEIDKLVEAGDWQGVVLAAARFEADQTMDGESFSASASRSSKWSGSATSATTPRSMATTDQSSTNISSGRSQAEIRAEVEALVRRVVPEEADNVDEMLTQFKGREEELVETLRRMQERAIASRARLAVQKSAKLEARARAASPALQQTRSSSVSVSSQVSSKSELEQAIESGNWEAVGEAAKKMNDQSIGSLSADERARLKEAISHSPGFSTHGTLSEESTLDALIERGDWPGVIAAAKRASEKTGHGLSSSNMAKEEQDALAQASMWQEIANQSKQEGRQDAAGAGDAAAWAISRSLHALNSPGAKETQIRTIEDMADEESSEASQYESSSYSHSASRSHGLSEDQKYYRRGI